MKKLLAVLVVVSLAAATQADLLVGWDFLSEPGNQAASTSIVEATGVQQSLLTRGSGLSASTGTNSLNSSGWTVGGDADTALAANDFLEWTVAASPGYSFSLTNFSFRWTRSSTGPTNLTLRSSLDNFVSDLGTWIKTDTTAANYEQALSLGPTTGVTFRLIGYRAGASAGTSRMTDGANFGQAGIDFAVFGQVIPEPATAILFTVSLGFLGLARRRR